MTNKAKELRPKLAQAQKALEGALEQACSTDISKANTGELIRIEEVLAIANQAAKEVVSVRRKLGEPDASASATRRADAGPTRDSSASAVEGAANASDARFEPHRTFLDGGGVQWTAFAVYPSSITAGRASLRGTFQYGWLAFDSGEETRRLTPVPDNWRALSDAELRELCERAERARRRRMPPPHQPPPTAG